jgi:hypothetical protein
VTRSRQAPSPSGPLPFALQLAAACATLAVLLGATGAAVTRDRPPPAHTGGFGEPTCQACHFDADINAGPGRLVVRGFPAHYEPGASYPLDIVVKDPQLVAAGFQLAVRFTGDGRQAGSLAPGPADGQRVEVTVENGTEYAHHGPHGIQPSERGAMRWTLIWTAPPDTAEVVLHAAANAADGDDSPLGDNIYGTAATSRGQRPSTSGRSTSRM